MNDILAKNVKGMSHREALDPAAPGGHRRQSAADGRGLTTDTINKAKELLAKLQSVSDAPALPLPDPQEQQAKEDALWAWYLECSQIARTVIEDKRLLRELGFINPRRRCVDRRRRRHRGRSDTRDAELTTL